MRQYALKQAMPVGAVLFAIAAILQSTEPAYGQCEVQWLSDPNGWSVDMDSQTAALGRWNLTGNLHELFVYRRVGLQLVEQTVLVSPDGNDSQQFARAVAVQDDWIAASDPPLNRVYMYREVNDAWIHEQTIEAPPGGAGRFGRSIAIDDDLMLVGAPWWGTDGITKIGTAHLFRFNGESWEYEAELPNPDPHEGIPGASPDNYGWSVALDGDRAVIGALTSKMNAGRVYVYERQEEDEWTLTLTLAPTPPDQVSTLGRHVGISGDVVMAAAPQAPSHGRVYIFDLDGENTWVQGDHLPGMVPPSPEFVNVNFGYGAALHESGTRFVASVHDDSEAGIAAGAAFLMKYDAENDRWVYQKKLIGSTVGPWMSYGPALAFDDDFVLVGAVNAVEPGQVHLFAGVLEEDCLETGQPDACDIFENEAEDSSGNLTPDPCQADLNNDGVVDVFDLLILIGDWGPCADPDECPADLNGDGAVDVFDLLILIGNWG